MRCRMLSIRWMGNIILTSLVVICTLIAISFMPDFHTLDSARSGVCVESSNHSSSLNIEECKPPDMTLENSQINQLFNDRHRVNCNSAGPDWIYLSRGKIVYNQTVIKYLKLENLTCTARFYKRKSDDKNDFLKPISVNDGFQMTEDYFNITCTASSSGRPKNYRNWHSGIAKCPKIFERLKQSKYQAKDHQWNVYFLGFDSTSRLTFLRKFPKSYKYLADKLDLIVLKRHNIVGDGTPQALLPMLTGQTELELPNTKSRDPKSNYCNVYPFIWYNFSKSGYATLYGEDSLRGAFTHRMTGFKESPVDHYTRNFWVSAYPNRPKQPLLCLGSQPFVSVHLDQFRQFFEVYEKFPKYLFTISDIGHNDNDKLGHGDGILLDHLKKMKNAGHLDRTILVLFGDHGARFSKVRQTFDGKMEERLPLFSFVLPESFKQRYPDAVANLRSNADRLTTHFDIHPTIMSVLNGIETGNGYLKDRGISLFKKIPSYRQCHDAGIEPHWCSCLKWKPVKVTDSTATMITNNIIDSFNHITEEFRNYCIPLRLNKLKYVYQMKPHVTLLNYEWVQDEAGFVPKYTNNYTNETKLVYQVTFDTMPGGNVYEVSSNYDTVQKKAYFDPRTVGILNRYYLNGHCIDKIDILKVKYCSCREKLKN